MDSHRACHSQYCVLARAIRSYVGPADKSVDRRQIDDGTATGSAGSRSPTCPERSTTAWDLPWGERVLPQHLSDLLPLAQPNTSQVDVQAVLELFACHLWGHFHNSRHSRIIDRVIDSSVLVDSCLVSVDHGFFVRGVDAQCQNVNVRVLILDLG